MSSSHWALVDRVRDRCYDVFTFDEKKRLHDLVGRLKRTGVIFADDLAWLREMDAALSAMGVSPPSRRPYEPWRRRPRAKRGRANG
ncbi:MAG TPA: hypothetical protein VIE66_04300 [Methylocella sp.]|jgi:hypothetical protein